ncbi:hypothetical protein P7K49_028216 [Saguinus oedipus]|uniref:Uncharacterized protein n=1 Tax=Saguinus oedipus TaxID=9490 RepID=A0ABQ9UCX5_SAGOE|nr:hypothetical protein P7K49_028216 [Saguinus oedipus]
MVSVLPIPQNSAASTGRPPPPPPPPRLNPGSLQISAPPPRTRPALDQGWAQRRRLLLGCASWLGWDFLPPAHGNKTTLQQALRAWQLSGRARGTAMGSVLSSDSGKSAPASATPRALEHSGDPQLPVMSFDCSVCLEVLHRPCQGIPVRPHPCGGLGRAKEGDGRQLLRNCCREKPGPENATLLRCLLPKPRHGSRPAPGLANPGGCSWLENKRPPGHGKKTSARYKARAPAKRSYPAELGGMGCASPCPRNLDQERKPT